MIYRFQGGAIGANGGGGMSLFGAFLFSEKSFCQNRDIKWPNMAQNGPKWPKNAQLFMRMSLFGTFLF